MIVWLCMASVLGIPLFLLAFLSVRFVAVLVEDSSPEEASKYRARSWWLLLGIPLCLFVSFLFWKFGVLVIKQ